MYAGCDLLSKHQWNLWNNVLVSMTYKKVIIKMKMIAFHIRIVLYVMSYLEDQLGKIEYYSVFRVVQYHGSWVFTKICINLLKIF